MQPPLVVHVIPALGQGGAERLLSDIIAHAAGRAEHRILALTDTAPFFPYPGASIGTLGLRRARLPLAAWPRAALALRRLRPDVVHAWLYHGNLFSALVPRGGAPAIWSIHNTTLPAQGAALTHAVNRAGALLSGLMPWRIVYCAEAARDMHEGLGYARKPGLVLENGVDFGAFAPNPVRRQALRAQWGLAEDEMAFGCAARFDPQKDHTGLAQAFARLAVPKARLVLAGAGCVAANLALMAALATAGVADRTLLLGPVEAMPDFHAAIDVLVIGSAFGEALPMVGLEAVASGLPIAATRLGAVADLALAPTHLAAPGNPAELAQAMALAAAAAQGARPGPAAKARLFRLRQRYDITAVASAYHALYAEAAASRG
jgi:glycosyltransferase involved in cell wall biosynthesis